MHILLKCYIYYKVRIILKKIVMESKSCSNKILSAKSRNLRYFFSYFLFCLFPQHLKSLFDIHKFFGSLYKFLHVFHVPLSPVLFI